MKAKEAENIEVGDIYYKQSRYDCKSCYRVKVVEILSDTVVLVEGMSRRKKGRKQVSKPFKTYISTLHTTPSEATGGNRKSYRKKKR